MAVAVIAFMGLGDRFPEPPGAPCQTDSGSLEAATALSALFPGSSAVEHSTVNRQVASSNLARGAIAVSFYRFITL